MQKIITTIFAIALLILPFSAEAKITFRPYISTEKTQVNPNQNVTLSAYNSFLAGGKASDYTYKWEIASAPENYTGEKKASGVGITEFVFVPNAIGNYVVELKLVGNNGTTSIPHYLTITTLSFNDAFSDLPESYWARNYFYDLYYAGVMTGYEDGTLRPEATVNRAEFLTMCMRAFAKANAKALTEIQPEQADTYFADVDSEQWYYDYIAKAVEKEIVSGYMDDTFRPENSVSLAEALKISVNFTNVIPEARSVNIAKIADVNLSDWYAKYISTAIDQGVITVKNYLKPNKAITRAQAAEIIDKIFFGKNTNLVSWNYLTK